MSIVKHKDKNSGSIIVYESTSHYDPVTKQSRPKRKYLGIEDPETGELIPSSGRRGRRSRKAEPGNVCVKKDETDYKMLSEKLMKECREKDARIKKLENENMILRSGLRRVREMADGMLGAGDGGRG